MKLELNIVYSVRCPTCAYHRIVSFAEYQAMRSDLPECPACSGSSSRIWMANKVEKFKGLKEFP